MDVRLEGRISRILGVLFFASGLVLNKFLLERVVSSDGRIASPTLNVLIVLGQFFLIGTGWFVYARRPVIQLSRRSIGTLLLMLFALQSVARVFLPQVGYLDAILKSGYQRDDEITAYEARFDCIRDALPKNAVIGYTTSQRVRDDWATFYNHYYLTQYTLAPLVVEESTQKALVIANFPDSSSMPSKFDYDGVALVKDCGSGVALLRGSTAE